MFLTIHCFPSLIAASHSTTGPPQLEAFEILDMAVCGDQAGMLDIDDNATASWIIPRLAELDFHNRSQCLGLSGFVLSRHLLPRLCQGIGTSQAACKIHVYQGDRLFLLLAGKSSVINKLKTKRSYFKVGIICKYGLLNRVTRLSV